MNIWKIAIFLNLCFKNIIKKMYFSFLLISKIVGANLNKDFFFIAAGQILADYKVKKNSQKKVQ